MAMDRSLLDRAAAPFSAWQRELVFEKKKYANHKDRGESVRRDVSVRQRELLAAVSSGPVALGRYLRGKLDLGEKAAIGAPVFQRPKLTPGEYVNPPVPLETELGAAWADDVSPKEASRSAFWLLSHIDWIEQGRLGGAASLKEALLEGPGRGGTEGQVRNFLRRTGGLPLIRGKTSVFSDCTLARAWWRHRIASEVAEVTKDEVSAATAHWALHASRPAWERLTMLSLRRLTVMNHSRARAAIVSELARRLRTYGRINEQQVLAMAMAIARLGLRSSLHHVSMEALTRTASVAR